MSMPKVSVVIATYNTGPRVEWTITELEAQSLPPQEFEVVVVDDGSSDDTFDRLCAMREQYPNLVVDRIENSGWPGRPRNVGVAKATGEYVFFMDHDDSMFPEALERMYNFAVEADADVVIPKEVVDGWHTAGWPTWRRDVPKLSALDAEALACITPHKLYRRRYLNQRTIAFPEGRIRLEDFDFNAQAYVHTDRIAVFSSYPCYTWIIGEGNSHKARYDFRVYWDSFERSLQPIVNDLPAGAKRDALLIRWYRSRILERLNPQMLGYSDAWKEQLSGEFERLLHYFPPHLDSQLSPADRPRSALLRRRDWGSLADLAGLDKDIRLQTKRVTASWEDDRLRLRCSGIVSNPANSQPRFELVNGRVRRALPAGLGLDEAATDVTQDLPAVNVDLIVRSRRDKVDWNLATRGGIRYAPGIGKGRLSFEADGELDIGSVAFGRPLDEGVWDVNLRASGLGWAPAAQLDLPKQITLTAVVDSRLVVVYTTAKDRLALDVGATFLSFIKATGASHRDVELTPLGDGKIALRWPLPNVHVPSGGTNGLVRGALIVGNKSVEARIVTGARGAVLIAVVPEQEGEQPVRSHFGSVRSGPHFLLVSDESGPHAVKA